MTVTEGNAGTATRPSRSRLGAGSGRTVTVDFATANGTATAPGDYTAGERARSPSRRGETTKTVTVPVNGDVLDEADETFFVNLSTPSNATIADGQGVGTITDDDPLPTLHDQRRHRDRGQRRHDDATFTVSLDAAERPDGHGRLRDRRTARRPRPATTRPTAAR